MVRDLVQKPAHPYATDAVVYTALFCQSGHAQCQLVSPLNCVISTEVRLKANPCQTKLSYMFPANKLRQPRLDWAASYTCISGLIVTSIPFGLGCVIYMYFRLNSHVTDVLLGCVTYFLLKSCANPIQLRSLKHITYALLGWSGLCHIFSAQKLRHPVNLSLQNALPMHHLAEVGCVKYSLASKGNSHLLMRSKRP